MQNGLCILKSHEKLIKLVVETSTTENEMSKEKKTRVKDSALIFFFPALGLKRFQLGPRITDVIIISIYIFRLCTKKCNNGQLSIFHCPLKAKCF